MTKYNRLASAVKIALITATASGAALSGTAVFAQEADEDATRLDAIVVTGSRIRGTDLASASPVQTIFAEDIRESGVINIQELLLKNPIVGAPGISRTNSNFAVASAGVATVDLRNLGTSRTLVLVDGRRFVAGVPGTSAVDLNSIPTQFIERVDILTGGASSVYGSDAVAGVVNIIYKKNFEGIEFDSQYGESKEGDNGSTQFNLTVGSSTSDGRGNIMFHAGYSEQDAVFSRDRDRSDTDIISRLLLTGDPADAFVAQSPFFSSFSPQGRFFAGADQFTFDQNNNLLNGFSTNGTATRAPNGFNRNGQRTIAVPTERYLFAGRGEYEFYDNHSVFFEGTYASSQTQSELEPFPLSSFDIFPGSFGQVPGEFLVDGVLRANPVIPTEIFNSMVDEDGDGLRDFYFTRRLSDVGNRGNVADRDTFRIVAGLQGSFGADWTYEAYYNYGQTKEGQVSGGQVNVLNFRNALEAVPDVNDLDGDGNTTEAICRDANAREQGCVPISLFGFGSVSPEAAAFVSAPGLLATFVSQDIVGLNITGELFNLPAGRIGVAVGGEYREEFSRSEFDPLQAAGLNAGNAIPREEGKFDVTEGYLEVNVPLLRDVAFAEQLDLRAAVRVSDYSTVGGTTSWNVGLHWAPIPQVHFRGHKSESVRAPNITELFAPPSQDFPADLVDPCVGVTATSTGATSEACRMDPGVLTNIAENGAFALTQSDIQGISGFNLGNPDLLEETGKSWSIGAVITPTGVPVLENFTFSIDYSNIEVEDAIVNTPRQFILDQCFGGTATELCSFVTRRTVSAGGVSAGAIEFIDTGPTNSGGVEVESLDVTVAYRQSLGPGDVSANLTYTRAIDGFLIPLPGAEKDEFVGETGASEDRAYLTLGYAWDKFAVNWGVTYIGSADLDDQFLQSFDFEAGSIGVGSRVYNDVQIKWYPFDSYELYVGATNLFDENPPPILTGLPGNVTGTETDAGVYDAIGTQIYGGIRIKF